MLHDGGLNIICNYKYQIDKGLELLNSGVVEQILMEEDNNIF